jgi:hypothetical protein
MVHKNLIFYKNIFKNLYFIRIENLIFDTMFYYQDSMEDLELISMDKDI